ncbi:LrgB family protein [Sporosarcina sp. OR05]|uniref:LrgB family protein n=1 Tax=Sporosarcina sp. OR05 TaxID=2969819 RepID=UPI00352AC581
MQLILFAALMILLTISSYFLMTKLYSRFHYSFLLPVLTSTILIIVILVAFQIPYESYMQGGQWINSLLGPAVVALAYPLYKQRRFLRKHAVVIFFSVSFAGAIGMLSVAILARVTNLSHTLSLSILPKSVTTPVAIAITDGIGGNASMAVVAVMIAGIFGSILAPLLLKWAKVHSPVGRGIALGSASHALGTAKAVEYGELAFSMGSVSMSLNALLSSILAPLIAWILLG